MEDCAYKNGAHGEVVATEVDARTNDSTGETEGGSAVDTHGFLDDCIETEEKKDGCQHCTSLVKTDE